MFVTSDPFYFTSGTDLMLSFFQDKAVAIRWKFYILYIFLKLSGKLE